MSSPSPGSLPEASEPVPAPSAGLSKGAQIAVGACLVGALLGWFGYTNLGDDATFQYYQTLEELRVAGSPAGRNLRVHGYVANHSIQRDIAAKQVRFAVQNDPPHAAVSPHQAKSATMPLAVVYTSLETPDLFKDGAEVVVEGQLQGSGAQAVFVADNVMAKCPSKFEAMAATEGQAGGQPL